MSFTSKISTSLFKEVDIASLVYFRICFAGIMLWEVERYFVSGWIKKYWIDPEFNFGYFGFEWVQPWAGNGMYYHFAGLGVLCVLMMIGLWYRLSAILFFFGFTYVFLLDQANYLNHFYLICLFSFLMIFIPSHRAFSLDAQRNPTLFRDTLPVWNLWLLRGQMGVVYFYGGIAKLNEDWLRGEPMRSWLVDYQSNPYVGKLFAQEWMVYFLSYGGIFFDLFIVPFLLWRKTRMLALAAALFFHLSNAWMYNIGIFPWFGIASTLLFFPPEWPRQVIAKFKKLEWVPVAIPSQSKSNGLSGKRLFIVWAIGIYTAFQVLIPLRHFLYPGNVSWTEEGHLFAWHMKLRDKYGNISFMGTDPETQESWTINPREYLSSRQYRKMKVRPEMILQFSHYVAQKEEERRNRPVQVRVHVTASLNSRKSQLMLDPTVDLSKESSTLLSASWILPLKSPPRDPSS